MAFQHVDNCRSLYINCQGEERRDKSEEYIMKARAEYLVSTRLSLEGKMTSTMNDRSHYIQEFRKPPQKEEGAS